MGRYGGWRKARAFVDSVAAGATGDFTITEDVDTNAIPRSLEIRRIKVTPTVATIRAIRLYTKATRIADPANADISLNYEDTWTDFTVASDLDTYDTTPVVHVDEDRAGNEVVGSIYGQMGVAVGSAASAFVIEISFKEKD